MKRLLLIALLLCSTNFIAQERMNSKSEIVSDQENHWMMNIATNPQMRLDMLQMMIDQTTDKPEEMIELVNLILSNSEMKKMISKAAFNNGKNSINMPEMMKKNNNIMKKTGSQKKPIIKN